MLSREWQDLYDQVIFVSPTFNYQNKLFSQLDPKGVLVYNRSLSLAILQDIVARRKNNQDKTCLLVFDDVGEVREPGAQGFAKALSDFIFISRHLRTSVCFLQQKLSSLPTSIRSQADFVLSFATMSKREKEALYEECSVTPTYKEFDQIFTTKTSKPFSYIIISVQNGVPKIF
jgi:hypothetical protein